MERELNYKAIGKRVKIARIKADMKQEHVAKKSGLSPTHISNIETGSTKASPSVIVSVANAIGVTFDDLLCDSLIHARPQFEQDIAELIEDCDDYETRMVKDITEALIATLRRDAHLGKNTVKYVRGQVCGLSPCFCSPIPVRIITGGGVGFVPHIPIHDLSLLFVHIQQNVQFIQTGRLCFQLVLLGKWLLNLYLCAGKLGFVGGQIVSGRFQVIIKVTEQIVKPLDIAVNILTQGYATGSATAAAMRPAPSTWLLTLYPPLSIKIEDFPTEFSMGGECREKSIPAKTHLVWRGNPSPSWNFRL